MKQDFSFSFLLLFHYILSSFFFPVSLLFKNGLNCVRNHFTIAFRLLSRVRGKGGWEKEFIVKNYREGRNGFMVERLGDISGDIMEKGAGVVGVRKAVTSKMMGSKGLKVGIAE